MKERRREKGVAKIPPHPVRKYSYDCDSSDCVLCGCVWMHVFRFIALASISPFVSITPPSFNAPGMAYQLAASAPDGILYTSLRGVAESANAIWGKSSGLGCSSTSAILASVAWALNLLDLRQMWFHGLRTRTRMSRMVRGLDPLVMRVLCCRVRTREPVARTRWS